MFTLFHLAGTEIGVLTFEAMKAYKKPNQPLVGDSDGLPELEPERTFVARLAAKDLPPQIVELGGGEFLVKSDNSRFRCKVVKWVGSSQSDDVIIIGTIEPLG